MNLLVDCWVLVSFTKLLNDAFALILSCLLNVTGPSNCERTCPEVPPSTKSLSLIVTSSKTTLSFVGSCPVTVGFGIS